MSDNIITCLGDCANPTLVLLPGWGFDSRVWGSLIPSLLINYRLILVDLPGTDSNQWQRQKPINLDSIAEAIVDQVGGVGIWLGWSLGAIVATYIASHYSDYVRGLITIGFNPCFVQRDHWPYAMPLSDYQGFHDAFCSNWQLALKRFCVLQTLGSGSYKKDCQYLQNNIGEQSSIAIAQLEQTLCLLKSADMRECLAQIRQPVLHLLGDKDQLVPVQIADNLIQINSRHKIVSIKNSSHVPFLSHPAHCLNAMKLFVGGL